MKIKVDEKTRAFVRESQQSEVEIINESHLAPLPEPIQRYLRFAQVLGKSKVRCAKVRQSGAMRLSSQQGWMPVEAVQYTTLAGQLSRMWYAQVRKGPFTLLSGYDSYDNGLGHMLMRLFSVFPVVDAQGPEIDMSALIIFINDMVMWPTAFLSDYIYWEPLNAMSACARIDLHGKQFSAEIRVNKAGELVNFITDQRYRSVGKTNQQTQWSTPFRKYREMNGLCIPSEGEAIWHLPEGEFPYFRAKIGQVQYDTFDFD